MDLNKLYEKMDDQIDDWLLETLKEDPEKEETQTKDKKD
jgi:hypothetical protein